MLVLLVERVELAEAVKLLYKELMETRNILDYLGNVIGTLSLPDSTSEETWQLILANYAVAPDNSAAESYKMFNIEQRKAFCDKLLSDFKLRNINDGINAIQGMHMHHRMRALEVSFYGNNFSIDVMNLAISGDIELACLALIYCTPDDMSDSKHWMSSARRDWLVGQMKAFLGWS